MAASVQQRPRQTARESERIDMTAGFIPEAAVPCVGAQHVTGLVAGEQLDSGAIFGPLSHAPLRDSNAAGGMHRLPPACLFLLGIDFMPPRQIEQHRSTITQKRDESFTSRAVRGDDLLRVRSRQGWNHLSV